MSTFDLEDPLKKTHSININVYKPGSLPFWKWLFNRKSSPTNLSANKSYRLKLNVDEINAMKIKGIDLEKLKMNEFDVQNTNKGKKNNTIIIPKCRLGLKENQLLTDFIGSNIKRKQITKTTKVYSKKVSTSTISISSKRSVVRERTECVQHTNSEKSLTTSVTSKASLCVGLKHNKLTAKRHVNKGVFSRSIPPSVLQHNTHKKLLIPLHLGDRKAYKIISLGKKSHEDTSNLNTENIINIEKETIDENKTKQKQMEGELLQRFDFRQGQKEDKESGSKDSEVFSEAKPCPASHSLVNSEKNKEPTPKYTVTYKVSQSKSVLKTKKKKKLKRKPLSKTELTIKSIEHGKLNNTSKNKGFVFNIPDFHKYIESTEKESGEDNNKHSADKQLPSNNVNSSLTLKNNETKEAQNKLIIELINMFNATIDKDSRPTLKQELQKLKNLPIIVLSKPKFEWKHKSLTSASESQLESKENITQPHENNSTTDNQNHYDKCNSQFHTMDECVTDINSQIKNESNNLKTNMLFNSLLSKTEENIETSTDPKIIVEETLDVGKNEKHMLQSNMENGTVHSNTNESGNTVPVKSEESDNANTFMENGTVHSNTNESDNTVPVKSEESDNANTLTIPEMTVVEGTEDVGRNIYCNLSNINSMKKNHARLSHSISLPGNLLREAVSPAEPKKDEQIIITISVNSSLGNKINIENHQIKMPIQLENNDYKLTSVKKIQRKPHLTFSKGAGGGFFEENLMKGIGPEGNNGNKTRDKLELLNFNKTVNNRHMFKNFNVQEVNKENEIKLEDFLNARSLSLTNNHKSSECYCMKRNLSEHSLPRGNKNNFCQQVPLETKNHKSVIEENDFQCEGQPIYLDQIKRKEFEEKLQRDEKRFKNCTATNKPVESIGRNMLLLQSQTSPVSLCQNVITRDVKKVKENILSGPITTLSNQNEQMESKSPINWSNRILNQTSNTVNGNVKQNIHIESLNVGKIFDTTKKYLNNKQPFCIIKKIGLRNQTGDSKLDGQKRSLRYGLTLHQPIFEESEDEEKSHGDQSQQGDSIRAQDERHNPVCKTGESDFKHKDVTWMVNKENQKNAAVSTFLSILQPSEPTMQPSTSNMQSSKLIIQQSQTLLQPSGAKWHQLKHFSQSSEASSQPYDTLLQSSKVTRHPSKAVSQPSESVLQDTEVLALSQSSRAISELSEVRKQTSEAISQPNEVISQESNTILQPTDVITQPTEIILQPSVTITQPKEAVIQPSGTDQSNCSMLEKKAVSTYSQTDVSMYSLLMSMELLESYGRNKGISDDSCKPVSEQNQNVLTLDGENKNKNTKRQPTNIYQGTQENQLPSNEKEVISPFTGPNLENKNSYINDEKRVAEQENTVSIHSCFHPCLFRSSESDSSGSSATDLHDQNNESSPHDNMSTVVLTSKCKHKNAENH